MNKNPDSFIAKIIGVFTFEGFETGSITLVIMKNVTKCSMIGVERIFDLKGSSHDREVIPRVTEVQKKTIFGSLLSSRSEMPYVT